MTTRRSPRFRGNRSVPRSPSYVGGNEEHPLQVRSPGTFPAFPEQQKTGVEERAGRRVRGGLVICRNVACEVNRRGRDLIGRLSSASAAAVETFAGSKPSAPTLRPQAINPQVENASADNGSDAQLRVEWAQLAAVWGIGGWVNAADEILKRNPAVAPPGAVEAGWRLLDLIEWAGIDSRHPLASETFRDHP